MDELKHSQEVTIAQRSVKYTPEQTREIHHKALAMLARQPGEGHAINARNDSHVINSSMSEVDQIVALLTQVVQRAQSLSEQDQRRVRDFVHVVSSTLLATTYLPSSDQKLFESTLRDAARKCG
jgi:hypothetical protein